MNARSWTLQRAALLGLLLALLIPVMSFAQTRWEIRRPRRNRIVVYQPRSDVVYQRRPVYSYRYNAYSQPYYSTQDYSYGYQPYANQYYSYRYAQPSVANRDYRYNYYGYRPRYRRSGLRIGIRLR